MTQDVDLGEPDAAPVRKGPACSVGRILADESTPLLAASVRRYLAAKAYGKLAEKFHQRGIDISVYTIRRHVRPFAEGGCKCDVEGIR